MDTHQAETFAAAWIEVWNARDLDAILALYADDVVFHSPLIAKVMPDGGDAVHGKEALRVYWTAALARVPELHFTLDKVFPGSDALTLLFSRRDGRRSAETFVFAADGRVVLSIGTHA